MAAFLFSYFRHFLTFDRAQDTLKTHVSCALSKVRDCRTWENRKAGVPYVEEDW